MGGRQRGELTSLDKRIKIVELIREAHNSGARLDKACEVGVIVKSGVWIKQQRSLIDPLLVNRL